MKEDTDVEGGENVLLKKRVTEEPMIWSMGWESLQQPNTYPTILNTNARLEEIH